MVVALFPDEALHAVRSGLSEPTLDYEGGDWGRDVFGPWLAANGPVLDGLRAAGRPEMAAVALDAADSATLYALSRVADTVLLPSQPPSLDPRCPGDWLPATAYPQFVAGIGGTFPAADRFHPFLHEIVAVQPAADPAEPPSLAGQWWPGCFVGSLLLLRAGVTVRAGAEHLDPVVAAASTLYWSSRRRYRKVRDVPGRTEFRRDYRLPGCLAYNVDARLKAGGMPHDGGLDLLRYRCGTIEEVGDDARVWDTHHSEPVPRSLSGGSAGVRRG